MIEKKERKREVEKKQWDGKQIKKQWSDGRSAAVHRMGWSLATCPIGRCKRCNKPPEFKQKRQRKTGSKRECEKGGPRHNSVLQKTAKQNIYGLVGKRGFLVYCYELLPQRTILTEHFTYDKSGTIVQQFLSSVVLSVINSRLTGKSEENKQVVRTSEKITKGRTVTAKSQQNRGSTKRKNKPE